jgi:hypothetical protein
VDLHLNGLGEWNQTRVSGPIIAQGRLGIGQFIPLSGNGRSNLAWFLLVGLYMVDGFEFELVELIDTGNASMKEITPGRSRPSLIMPKFKPVKPKTGIQIPGSPLPSI